MKHILKLLVLVLTTTNLWAQTPQNLSYQAVVRDAGGELVNTGTVGMQISIVQGDAAATAVYVETQTPTANANGLVSLDIGAGTNISGDFTTIDWANGPYFIKIETDPTGGTNYTIAGTSQLLSVPYALYAETAGSVNETDPVYTQSEAANITAVDITNIENLSGTNTGDQDLSGYLTTETDPTVTANFDLTDPADGDLLQYDSNTGKWLKRTMTGDVTINTTGATNLGDATVTTSKLEDASVTDAKLDKTNIPLSGFGAAQADIDLGSNRILFSNAYPNKSDLPSASDYHGMFAHVHGTGKAYFAHAGDWIEINATSGTTAGEMQYWNGTDWVSVEVGTTGQILTYSDGKPTWIDKDTNFDSESGFMWKDITSSTGQIWMDRNLGATAFTTTDRSDYASDEDYRAAENASFGDLYQWGRSNEGHQLRNLNTETDLYDGDVQVKPSSATAVGDWSGKFITDSQSDWLSTSDIFLWNTNDPENASDPSPGKGATDPCPSGYRIPLQSEWQAEIDQGLVDSKKALENLKLPSAGMRNDFNGLLSNYGFAGNYWSSTAYTFSPRGYTLFFNSTDAYTDLSYRTVGASVRCIKD